MCAFLQQRFACSITVATAYGSSAFFKRGKLMSDREIILSQHHDVDVGKQLVLLKRQDDGTWKTLAASVSSDLPPA